MMTAESELYLWRVRYYGQREQSGDFSEEDREVWVEAETMHNVLEIVQQHHDETALFQSVKRMGHTIFKKAE